MFAGFMPDILKSVMDDLKSVMDDPHELALAMFALVLCAVLLVAGEIYLVTRPATPAPEIRPPEPAAVSSAAPAGS
jgi:hypothetical protein